MRKLKQIILSLYSSGVLSVALGITSIRSVPPPLTPSPLPSSPFLCSQTPLRQDCKGADLLWFSWTKRRQTDGDRRKERERKSVREGNEKGFVKKQTPASLILPPEHTCFPQNFCILPRAMALGNKGVEEGGRGEGARCNRRQEQRRLCAQTKI